MKIMQRTDGAESKREAALPKGIFFIVLSAFAFSLMSLCVRKSGELPFMQKALFRNSVATVAAFCVLLKNKSFRIEKGNLPALLMRSVTGTLGLVLNFYAIDHMNVADASILNKLAPFFAMIFSAIIIKEKPSGWDWALVGVAFIGAVFVAKPTGEITDVIPALAGVLGGLGAGIAYAYVRLLSKKGQSAEMTVFFFSAFSVLFVLPFALMNFQPMELGQVLWLLGAGAAASVAQFSLTVAYKYAPAKDISVYDYSQVLFTAIWGMAFLSEFPDGWSLFGYAIIIGAAVVKYLLGRTVKIDKNNQEK